jgi:murein DD-endopeptidase MepM/ murein hydrolase activator NlpD
MEAKQEQFKELQAAAEAEVVHLQEVEQKRLEDERVREALLAQQREEQRQRELAERQQREAAAAQAAAAQAALAAAPAAAAAPAPQPAETSAPSQESSSGEQLPAAPAPEPADDESAAPSPPPPPRSGIACPVAGSSAYSDTWGASRSGGRSHQGVDMLASRGTPLVAVVSGSVQFKQTSLGGNSVWLAGSDGNRYFYAHLDSFEGSSRGVSQGEVIGYVGDTGNARGTNHLHFEVHPGGGAAVNPYPYVRDAGC